MMLNKAIAIASQVHTDQVDKADRPYILHPLRVMMKMETIDEMITAVLHDVIEDSQDPDKWTTERLRSEGFPQEILDALDNLTKRKGENYEVFIERAKKSPLSRKVKLADIEDNMDMKRMKSITEKDSERLKKYHRAWIELKKEDGES